MSNNNQDATRAQLSDATAMAEATCSKCHGWVSEQDRPGFLMCDHSRQITTAEQRGYERGVKALRDALIKDATLNERWITPHATKLLDAESGDAE